MQIITQMLCDNGLMKYIKHIPQHYVDFHQQNIKNANDIYTSHQIRILIVYPISISMYVK